MMKDGSDSHFRVREILLTSSRRKVPEVSLRIPCRVLPLAVRLACWRRIYGGSDTLGLMIVRVNVVDEAYAPAWLRWQRPGRDEAALGVDPMDPDYRVPRVYRRRD